MKLSRINPQLLVLGLAAAVFLFAGATRMVRSSNDFVPVYTGARCLLHGCNPYEPSQLEQQFFAAGGHAAELPSWEIDVPVYPPSTFLILSPLAGFRFPTARLLWFLLNGSLFVTSAALVTFLCPPQQRWAGTVLVSLFLITSGILLVLGQPALLAISLLVIGTYLFLRGRLLLPGSLLLMLSLAVKPQIGGLVVLYLLARRIHWRYAALACAGACALLLCAGMILKANPRSARWPATLSANLSATLSPGGSADPRPANQQAIGDVNLQAVTSIFFADARAFNLAAYGIFLVLLIAWLTVVLRAQTYLHLPALAALALLTLLPVYHRFYDTRLLLLTVPAVVMVAQTRRLLGALMAVLTLLAMVSVQYRVQALLLQQGRFQTMLGHKLWFTLLLRQQTLELLLLFCLYLAAIHSWRGSRALAAQPGNEPALALQRS